MPLTLSKIKPLPGLSFNDQDGKHIHLIEGREVPGCTTIAGLFSDDGWKFAWPPKLMAEKLMCVLNDGKVICAADIKEAKGAWREKRDKSADSGSRAHALIETYIKTGMMNSFLENKEVENCIANFLTWEEKLKPAWMASELQVGSLIHGFAGILDALAEIDGKLVLMDFKTSSGIKLEYSIQLAGLMICLEEMGVKPTERAILHLPKDGEYEYKVLNGNLEFEKECFLAAKTFYGFKNKFMGGKK